MATDLTQDAVLRFLLARGGSARNAELLAHFARFLRAEDEATRARNRELFKRHVNGVATVVRRDGDVSYVVLRKKYRSRLEASGRSETQPPSGPAPVVLPVAGIVNNNNNNNDAGAVNLERQAPPSSTGTTRDTRAPEAVTDSKRSSGSGQSFEQPWETKGPAESGRPAHNGAYGAKPGQSREVDARGQQPFCPPHPGERLEETAAVRDSREEPSPPWPFPISRGQSQISASSPCLADVPHAQLCVRTGLSRSNDSFLAADGDAQVPRFYLEESEETEEAASASNSPVLQRRRLQPPPGDLELGHLQGLSSSQTSLPLDRQWARALPRETWSSDDLLNRRGVVAEGDRDAMRRSHDAELLSQLCRPERGVAPWHHSTGHLLDDEPQAALPASSLPEDGARLGPVARRLSQRLRSRLCRSLGSDLDHAFREDGGAARLKRLHRISSFLSVNCSMSSVQTHSSLGGLSSAGSAHSLGHDSVFGGPRQPQVPLESREHEWFVKAATGNWGDVYSLFREEPGLLNRRDFVSGYSVLHWIAKHGDHRVLNTLWYGVNKAGVAMDVDVRSASGYTPLHLAAIHGHKNLLRLLVHKFKANVALRDNSGRRPWQYLDRSDNWELLEMLGAPRRAAGGGAGVQWSVDKPPVLPAAPAGAVVKRHSSLAALFKHKAQLRLSANAETFL